MSFLSSVLHLIPIVSLLFFSLSGLLPTAVIAEKLDSFGAGRVGGSGFVHFLE